MNALLWLLMLAATFAGVLLSYRFWGRLGLYIWIPISVIVANIQVVKTVEVFGLTATLGNIVYAGSFLVTDILSENYGRRAAFRAVMIGFFALIVSVVLMNIALRFTPDAGDFAQESLEVIFGFLPRIALGSLVAYGISQLHDIWAYDFWKRVRPAPQFIWLRNNASTMVSQLIDSAVFTAIAFLGVFPTTEVLQIFITTYVLKWLVAAADTPLVYLARFMYHKGLTGDDHGD